MFAPSFRLSTFDSRLCGCAILILNARSQRSLPPSRCKFPMALKMKKSLATPLECTLTRKGARKSFGIHSYKFKGLKLPWNDTVTKNAGWVGAPQKWKERKISARPSPYDLLRPNLDAAHILGRSGRAFGTISVAVDRPL